MNIITETAFVNSTPKERVRKAGRGRVSAGKFIRSVLEKLNVPVKNNRNQEANTNYTDLYPFYTELNLWHAYAFIIESNGRYPSKTFPDGSFANYWISSLNLTGLSDSLSSAGGKKGAVSVINCDMKLPKEDTVSAREIIMVGMDDTELIKKYHLENADFDDDYEIVIPDRNYREYKLAEGSNTPFYMQYPEDGAHRLYYAYDMDEYMKRSDVSEENTCMMYLYLNEDDEVVYGFEEYTP